MNIEKVKRRIEEIRELEALSESFDYKIPEEAAEALFQVYLRLPLSYHPDSYSSFDKGFEEFSFSEYIVGFELNALLSKILYAAGKIKKRCRRESVSNKLIGSVKRKLKMRIPKYDYCHFYYRDESDFLNEDTKLTFCAKMYMFLNDFDDEIYSEAKKYLALVINDLLAEDEDDLIGGSAILLRLFSAGCGGIFDDYVKKTEKLDFCRMNILKSFRCAFNYQDRLNKIESVIRTKGTDYDNNYFSLYKKLLRKWTDHGLDPVEFFDYIEDLITGCMCPDSFTESHEPERTNYPPGLTKIIASEMKKEGRHFGPDQIEIAVTSNIVLKLAERDGINIVGEINERFYRCLLYYEICDNVKSYGIFDKAAYLFIKEHSLLTGEHYLELIPEAVQLKFKTGDQESGRKLIQILHESEGIINKKGLKIELYSKMAKVCILTGERKYVKIVSDKIVGILKENKASYLWEKDSIAKARYLIAVKNYDALLKLLSVSHYRKGTVEAALLGSLNAGNTDFAVDLFYKYCFLKKTNSLQNTRFFETAVRRIAESYFQKGDIDNCAGIIREGRTRREQFFKESHYFGIDNVMYNYFGLRLKRKEALEPFSDMEDMYGLKNSRKIYNIAEMNCNYEILANLTEDNLEIAGYIIRKYSG